MRIDGRLEFRAPETSASSSCILSNTMADPIDDFNELFLFTGTQPSAVHRKPSNEYQNFVNVFCFMNWSDGNREHIVQKGQAEWKSAKNLEQKRRDLSKGF